MCVPRGVPGDRAVTHPTIMRGHCLRFSCAACGPFGIKAKRRARHADDEALVAFHAHLADQIRHERVRRAMVDAPLWATDLTVRLIDHQRRLEKLRLW